MGIHAGPHWIMGAIPAPRHGTFHKIGHADKLRAIGITASCATMWVLLIVIGLIAPQVVNEFNNMDRDSPTLALMIHTDMPNLITNTMTTPMLIYFTWRPEPSPKSMFEAIMHAMAKDRKG